MKALCKVIGLFVISVSWVETMVKVLLYHRGC